MVTKNNFKFALAKELELLGFKPLPFPKEAYALFHKKIGDLHLTLAIETSRLSKETFTGSLYFAPTFSWAYAPPNGFPEKAYSRIGPYLTPAERKEVVPTATAKQVDVWWKGFNPANASAFAKAAGKAANRMIATKGLADKVRKAPAMLELLEQLDAVRKAAGKSPRSTNRHLTKVKREAAVPEVWYLAAAALAAERFEDYNQKDGIKMLAEEAWLLENFV